MALDGLHYDSRLAAPTVDWQHRHSFSCTDTRLRHGTRLTYGTRLAVSTLDWLRRHSIGCTDTRLASWALDWLHHDPRLATVVSITKNHALSGAANLFDCLYQHPIGCVDTRLFASSHSIDPSTLEWRHRHSIGRVMALDWLHHDTSLAALHDRHSIGCIMKLDRLHHGTRLA
jgi:hypothetical protein